MAADALAGLIAELPEGMVVTDPAITEGYRQDRALDSSAGKPLAVVRARRTEDREQQTKAYRNEAMGMVAGLGVGYRAGEDKQDSEDDSEFGHDVSRILDGLVCDC